MSKFTLLSLLVLVCIIGLSQKTYADCVITGPNGLGNIINCPSPIQTTPLNTTSMPANTTTSDDIVTIPELGGVVVMGVSPAITTSFGNDTINVNGQIKSDSGTALLASTDNDMLFIGTGADIMGNTGISMTSGVDLVEVNDGSITGVTSYPLNTGSSDDTVEVNGGIFTSQTVSTIIRMDSGEDTLTINGGTFIGPAGPGTGQLTTNTSSDNIVLSGGTYNQNEIDSASSDDTITVTADLPDVGLLNCGSGTGDTLTFSMDVPQPLVAALSSAFIAAGDTGSLTVNGITYNWSSCENRIPNFNGIVMTISLAPFFSTNQLLEDHTVTATVLTDGAPAPGVDVSFEVTDGPNAGLTGDDVTDANGEATFTFTSDFPGIDTIVASYDDPDLGIIKSNSVSKTWQLIRNVPTLSEWGLISMTALLGIVGFIAIRRRKTAA